MMDNLANIKSSQRTKVSGKTGNPNKLRGSNEQGKVILVGAGPGDPNLLTLGAMKAIQTADVIVYDNLVSSDIRALFPETTTKQYVGKAKGQHSSTQDQINQILIESAQQGNTVCRVKGGDSFVFGRGGEEMLSLAENGIEVDVVPGITAASGCTSYANIPLTHRGLAQGCTYITAHAEKDLEIQWSALAQLNQTLVIYMGLSKVELISDNLIKAGMSRTTPVALIEKGCCPDQRTFTGQLDDLVQLKEAHQVRSPALIVIGSVVSVAEQMKKLAEINQAEANHANSLGRLSELGTLREQQHAITIEKASTIETATSKERVTKEQLKLTA
ncbi:uroporphyrinogen-III C-methyltransferase [Vibrio tapetis subsp. quintayensis]|uniref:uroporphyrinogen-III C-methyltransferase n=1 Tax=Vibrio tapetis TaxID=52443 RepID=UPI0025B40C24|nr:uroporphyrinogen-III C-methyltransferase [Vibrio tapetis]MDN3683059.1 uroporphyrinogen-III C-methyltransferase [Vibrio tapetis subsp. quintayensis]